MDLIIILIFSPEMHPSSDGSTESETEEGEETADALWIAIIEVAPVVGRGWKLDVISVSPLLERPNSR